MRPMTFLWAILVCALFLTSAVVQPWNDPGAISLSVERGNGLNDTSVQVNYSISGSSYSDPVNFVLMPLNQYRSDPIYLFIQKDLYSTEEYASVLGLFDHLRAELADLGSHQTVEMVDHLKAEEVLNGDPAVLIVVNSTQDWSSESTAMMSWVERGGLLFGIGEGALPFISTTGSKGSGSGEGYSINYDPLNYDDGQGVQASIAASALDLKYSSPRNGMRVDDLDRYGQAIGYLYTREHLLTSAALIHRGNGSIILFSDDMRQPFTTSMEDSVSYDICTILVSGLPWLSGQMYLYQTNGGSGTLTGSFIAQVNSSRYLSCYAFSVADHQRRNRVVII
jgi:hypothetical protein